MLATPVEGYMYFVPLHPLRSRGGHPPPAPAEVEEDYGGLPQEGDENVRLRKRQIS